MPAVAVQGCTILAAPVTGGTIQVLTPPSTKLTVGNKGVYAGDIQVLVAGTSLGSATQTAPVTIKISPKIAQKLTVGNQKVLVVGDFGMTDSPASFQQGQTTITSPITLTILDAGQTKLNTL